MKKSNNDLNFYAKNNKANFNFIKGDLTNNEDLNSLFNSKKESSIDLLQPKISCIINATTSTYCL